MDALMPGQPIRFALMRMGVATQLTEASPVNWMEFDKGQETTHTHTHI